MEFRQIQYFVCLYEEGSVTRAARRLNIVQPALSMQIAKLEAEVRKPLFQRTSQGMQPTVDGRRMYRLFLPVVGDFAQARASMLHNEHELSGAVRVGMIETISQGVLVQALQEFSMAHPNVALSVTDGFSGILTDAVAGGQLDAAVINKPRRPLALAIDPIAEEDVVLVASTSRAPLPPEVPFKFVKQLRLVLPTRQHGLRGILESFAQAENVDLAPSLEIDSINAILRMVACSDFCTLLPRIAVRDESAIQNLRTHAVIAPRLTRQLVCVTHPRRALTPAAAAFVDVLLNHVRGLGALGTDS